MRGRRGRREAARVQFEQAIRSDTKFIPPQIALAELEIQTGEYGKAVILAESILEREDKNPRAMLLRAIGLRSMDKRDEARKAFELLVALYPKYSEGLFQFGVLDAMENKAKRSRGALPA